MLASIRSARDRLATSAARSFAVAVVIAVVAWTLSMDPASAQRATTKGNPNDLSLTINGHLYKFLSGITKAAEIIKAMDTPSTLTITNPDGGRTLVWTTSDFTPPDFIAGPVLKSYIFNFDNQDVFLSETVRDDSANIEVRAARNRQLADEHAKVKEIEAANARAFANAEMALLVIAGNSRCNWPVSAANLLKADALVKNFRKYTNDIDYAATVARAGETKPVEQNEFCFGPKWHGIFDNAAKALATTPSP